jgi:hypothetical protein
VTSGSKLTVATKRSEKAPPRARPQPVRRGPPPPTTADAFRLSVTSPTDASELEAERISTAVLADAPPPPISPTRPGRPSRACACGSGPCTCEDEPASVPIARVAADPPASVAPTRLFTRGDVLAPSVGAPLDPSARAYFEPRFGRDFGAVRVHTGQRAGESAGALGATAYTAGPNVVFRERAYDPKSRDGRALLSHELVHVAQQGYAPPLAEASTSPVAAASSPVVQRQIAAPPDPTIQSITADTAKALNNTELEEAISKTEAYLQVTPVPDVRWSQAANNLDLLKKERERRLHPTAPTEAETGARSAWEEGAEVGKLGIVQIDAGTALRRKPDPAGEEIRTLPLNTRMAVDRRVKGGWYFVIFDNGEFGYVAESDVNTSLPDPEARLYRIEEGMSAQKIVKRFFKNFVWGKDERFYVNVLVFVNNEAGRKGIAKPSLDADWDTTVTKAGAQIWIPGDSYAEALRGKVSSGSFTYETWSAIKGAIVGAAEFLFGVLAFVVGILHGALQSLWDLVVGVVDLIEMVGKIFISIIKDEIVSDATALWHTISALKLSDIIDAVEDWLDKRWNADGIWSRWQFRGWFIGYIIMEILLLVFSDGIITAVKWVGRSAKLAKLLEKIPMLAKVVKRAEALKDVKALEKLKAALKGSEALSAATKWAEKVLLVPAELLKDLTLDAIELLKKLPDWAIERFRELTAAAKRAILGCASPCKVNLEAIVKYLAEPATKAIKGAKRLLSVEEVIAALPKDLNVVKIRAYLTEYPALMEGIKGAELTDTDLAKLADFLTKADRANPETAYKTFVRYLTYVVPSKSGGDVSKFNKIVEAMVAADARQGAALKGSMWEAFARVHLPEFSGKAFRRVRFTASGTLALTTEARSSDFFIELSGELWDFKHSLKVDVNQAADYVKILNHAEAGLPKVTSINYLFPSEAWAKSNRFLADSYGFLVHYVGDAGKVVLLK